MGKYKVLEDKINEIIEYTKTLDERIVRFETGAAYERAESSHDQMIKKCEHVFYDDEAQDYVSFMVNKLIDAGLIEFVKEGNNK